jgi:pentatricopeptide repeat protein
MITESEDKKYAAASSFFKSGDYEKALVLYRDLANRGSRSAIRFLGWMYLCGQGVGKTRG